MRMLSVFKALGSPGDARGILGLPYGDKKALSKREVGGVRVSDELLCLLYKFHGLLLNTLTHTRTCRKQREADLLFPDIYRLGYGS